MFWHMVVLVVHLGSHEGEAGLVLGATVNFDLHATALREDPLYLDRCQVNTPDPIVELAWDQVRARRDVVGKVVDFGAGDARFARHGIYASYVGYEIDADRFASEPLPRRVRLVARCAFTHDRSDADLCIGNPPYVRNQDLPLGWRQMAATEVERRTGVTLSGLANAWQYFMMLALSSVKRDGLVVLVVPFEWVSRPAAEPIRRWITDQAWEVDVYRLPDGTFGDVLTAASITVIDKRASRSSWRFHELSSAGLAGTAARPTPLELGVIPYSRAPHFGPQARRGLSPGTQKALTLTEGERVHAGLRIGVDVVRCVTSLRPLPLSIRELSLDNFDRYYRDSGVKCWLIRTKGEPSTRLRAYLESVDRDLYQTATCLNRAEWWRFPMPKDRPQILLAQAFKGSTPKMVTNIAKVIPVGGVAGIYGVPLGTIEPVMDHLSALDVHERLVPYANQMHKLEINQLNTLLHDAITAMPSTSGAPRLGTG